MKRLFLAVAGLTLAGSAAASSMALPYPFKADPDNLLSVQRGARNYMNYCSGCHSMKHLRYSRLGRDLEIPDDELEHYLMFTSDKPGDHILSSMPRQSEQWFGQPPPDLTVETRMRGPDWVYNYLMTFYVDPSRPAGVNNLVLPGASMPHVLGDLQGWQVMKHDEASEGHGGGHGSAPPLETVVPGSLSNDDYRKFVADTVNFMIYAAEPGRAGRISLGVKVIFYLLILTVLAYLMKREWWRDVH